MEVPKNLNEDIQQQINVGFERNEIINNLRQKGYADTDIKAALVNFRPIETSGVSSAGSGSVSTKSILIGVLFLVIVVFRIARYSNSNGGSSWLLGISIFTALGLAIYYFTKKS